MDFAFPHYQAEQNQLQFEVYDLDTLEAWEEALAPFQMEADITQRPCYLAACEAGGMGKASCVHITHNDQAMLLPLLSGAVQAYGQQVYSFGGPLWKNPSPGFQRRAMEALENRWRVQNIVSATLFLLPEESFAPSSPHWAVHSLLPINIMQTADLSEPMARSGLTVENLPLLSESLQSYIRLSQMRNQYSSISEPNTDFLNSLLWEMGSEMTITTVRSTQNNVCLQAAITLYGHHYAHLMLARPELADVATSLLLNHIAHQAACRGTSCLVSGETPPMRPAPGAVLLPARSAVCYRLACWNAQMAPFAVTQTDLEAELFASFR